MRRSTRHRSGLFDLQALVGLIDGLYPRFLSQIDRDPDSPTYGSCDRQFWMYRLHDFDSGVVQQGGLVLSTLSELAAHADLSGCRNLSAADAPYWRSIASAVDHRTVRLLRRSGFLDEYYPGERSYPGTVFAAYATLASAMAMGEDELVRAPGLERTARALLGRRPGPAANQDQAAAAFLALYSRARSWRKAEVAETVEGLVGGPDGSGRFMEYGGADLGYMSVSLNYLAAMHVDGTHPVEARIQGLGRFIADFVSPAGRLGGEYASRSTTYFLPFGLVVAAGLEPELASAFRPLDVGTAFERLDDRYVTHYALASLVRAAVALARQAPTESAPPSGAAVPDVANHAERGLMAVRNGGAACFVGLTKGGTFQLELGDGRVVVDCGYRLRRNGRVYATAVHHSRNQPTIASEGERLTICVESPFQRYATLVASPAKTVALRTLRALGPSLNSYFKRRLISSPDVVAGPRLLRRLTFDFRMGTIRVEDEVRGLGAGDMLSRAPAVSPRLVPSARFHQPGETSAHLASASVPVLPKNVTEIPFC